MISYFMSYKFYCNDWGVSSVLNSETDPPVHEQKNQILMDNLFGIWCMTVHWNEAGLARNGCIYIFINVTCLKFKKIYTYYTKHTVPKMVHFSLNNF